MKFHELKKLLKARLNSASKAPSVDGYGNVVYTDHDVFSDDALDSFLTLSLSHFNQTPTFTDFNFKDESFMERFASILVDGAVINALASQSLVEKGREFVMTDGSVTFDPPNVSELMHTQWAAMHQLHHEKVRSIKLKF